MKTRLATLFTALCLATAFPADVHADTKASREAARENQRKADQQKEAKDLQAAKEAQAAKDAKAARDAKDAKDAQAQAAKAQPKKITTNILKGGLPKETLDTLDAQLKTLADVEKDLTKGESKLTRDELKQLFDAVGTSTATIWEARQGTTSTQTTVYHLGSSVFVKGDFATKLFTGDLTRSDAHLVARDFRQLLEDEKSLVAGDDTPDAHTKAQNQFNEVINKYFETHDKTGTTANTTG